MNGNSSFSFSNSNSFSQGEAASLPWCFRAAMPVPVTRDAL